VTSKTEELADAQAGRVEHPTRTALVDTAIQLIDAKGPEGLTAEEVLSTSGVSNGSLYHHFDAFDELLLTAQVRRATRHVDEDIAVLKSLMDAAQSSDEFFELVASLTHVSLSDERADRRLERVQILGAVQRRPEFLEAMGFEQQRLTNALTALIDQGKERGWVADDLDTGVVAVFLQAAILGSILNDIMPTPIAPKRLENFVTTIFNEVLRPH